MIPITACTVLVDEEAPYESGSLGPVIAAPNSTGEREDGKRNRF
jgi:hypothetical protein